MAGVRYCSPCLHEVYNLSEMTMQEAEELISRHEGILCVRYYQRLDGTVMTRECPIGVAKAQRSFRRGIAILASVLLGKIASSWDPFPVLRFIPVMGSTGNPQSTEFEKAAQKRMP